MSLQQQANELKKIKYEQFYIENEFVDCLDSTTNSVGWKVARVLSIKNGQITVNFDGWNPKFEEVQNFNFNLINFFYLFFLKFQIQTHKITSTRIQPFKKKSDSYT